MDVDKTQFEILGEAIEDLRVEIIKAIMPLYRPILELLNRIVIKYRRRQHEQD